MLVPFCGISGRWKRLFCVFEQIYWKREMKKLKIGFIGAGRVGRALGLYFTHHGLIIAGYSSRTPASAKEAAALTGSKWFYHMEETAAASDVLFLTTPDHVLPEADKEAAALLQQHPAWRTKIWLHVSGAHSSACLAALSAAGCPVGSLHPLQSFGDPAVSAKMLEKTYFSTEGTPKALEAVERILKQTGAACSRIETDKKPLYHAGACVLSNYLVMLIDTGLQLMQAAGMDRETLFPAVMPLIDGTLENIREQGTVQALTGPIVRADYGTVAAHCRAVDHSLPQLAGWYRALALQTVNFAENGGRLGCEQAENFRKLLQGCGSNEQ
ncbi:MAG: DUF2520 domain-containing protein [Oscillospiraceae bacterium]|nr:DUF2520 domain-containing protein [Oscillospiraceae bacterium]